MYNGLAERLNRSMKTMLKMLSRKQPRQWPSYIKPLLFPYHDVPQYTGFPLFELMYGKVVKVLRFIP